MTRRFFFDTGSLALALVDTVGARGRPLSPGGGRREYLDSPRALAAWARQAGLGAGRLPAPAELRRVQLLREAIYRLRAPRSNAARPGLAIWPSSTAPSP